MRPRSLLIIGMASWAALYPLLKLLGGRVDPYLLALIRYAVAVAILAPFLLIPGRVRWPPRQQWPGIFLIGFIGTAITTVLISIGVEHSTASASSILVNTNPLMVALLAPLLLRERTTPSQVIGIIMGIIGIVFVVLNGKTLAFSSYVAGSILLLLAALSQALYAIWIKPLVKVYGGLATTVFMGIGGVTGLLVITVVGGQIQQIGGLSAYQWLILVLIGSVATALAAFLWINSLKKMTATTSTSFKLLIPVFATLYSVVFLREPLTLWIVGGMALTSAGIALAQQRDFLSRIAEWIE